MPFSDTRLRIRTASQAHIPVAVLLVGPVQWGGTDLNMTSAHKGCCIAQAQVAPPGLYYFGHTSAEQTCRHGGCHGCLGPGFLALAEVHRDERR